MAAKRTPVPRRTGTANGNLDVSEWTDLGARLARIDPEKYEQLLDAMRDIVGSREALAEFDRELFTHGGYPA